MNSVAVPGIIPNRIQFAKASHTNFGNTTSLNNPNGNNNSFLKKSFGSSNSSTALPSTSHKQGSNEVTIEQLILPPQPKWISQFSVDTIATWAKPNPPSRGLNNLGNTCFMNSTLQCLASIPTFVQFLQLQQHSEHCTIPKEELCIFCYVEKFIGKVIQTDTTTANLSSAATPKTLANNIRILGKQFRIGRQEDSHEFLRCLLERMVRNALRIANVKEGSKDRMDETTAIHRIFGGYFRNQVHCTSCNYDSNSYDAFLDLSLEVGNGISSVDKALRHFSAKETLDEHNKWKCPRCKKDVRAVKQLTIRAPPPVLTIQLKRFSYTPRVASTGNSRKDMMRAMFAMMGGGSKLTAHVEFSDKLDITSALADSALQEKAITQYYLHGVLVHNGHSANSGHYYSYIKAPNGSWYCMNDSSVSHASWALVSKQQAYMLFYSRVPTSSRNNSITKSLPVVPSVSTTTSSSTVETTESKKLNTLVNPSSSSSNVSTSMNVQSNLKKSSTNVSSSANTALTASTNVSTSTNQLPDNVDDFENMQWKPNRAHQSSLSSRFSFSSSSKAATLPEKLLGSIASPSASTAAALVKVGGGKLVSAAVQNPSVSILSTSQNNDDEVMDSSSDDDDGPNEPLTTIVSYSTDTKQLYDSAYWRKKEKKLSGLDLQTLSDSVAIPHTIPLSRSMWDRRAIVEAHIRQRISIDKNNISTPQHLLFDESNEQMKTDSPALTTTLSSSSASILLPTASTKGSASSVFNGKIQKLLQKSLDIQNSIPSKKEAVPTGSSVSITKSIPQPQPNTGITGKEKLDTESSNNGSDSDSSEAPEEVSFSTARKDGIAVQKQISKEVNKSKKELRLLQKPKVPTVSLIQTTNQHVRIDDEGNESKIYRPRSPEIEPEQSVPAPLVHQQQQQQRPQTNSQNTTKVLDTDESMDETSSSSDSKTETHIPIVSKPSKENETKPVSNPFASTLKNTTKNNSSTKKTKKSLENVEITGKRRVSDTFTPSMLLQHSSGLQVKPSPSSIGTTLLSVTPTQKPIVKGWDDDEEEVQEKDSSNNVASIENPGTSGTKREWDENQGSSVQPKWSDKYGRNALGNKDRLWDEEVVPEEEWNQILDTGKRKKIKEKLTEEEKNNNGQSFQATLDKQREQRSLLPESGQGYRKGSFRTEEENRGSSTGFRGRGNGRGNFRGGGGRGGFRGSFRGGGGKGSFRGGGGRGSHGGNFRGNGGRE